MSYSQATLDYFLMGFDVSTMVELHYQSTDDLMSAFLAKKQEFHLKVDSPNRSQTLSVCKSLATQIQSINRDVETLIKNKIFVPSTPKDNGYVLSIRQHSESTIIDCEWLDNTF